jgi:hypothetical protein
MDEMVRRRRPTIELKAVVPQLSIIQEVERRILEALILRCAAEHEVSFATVEPRHRIACTVKFGKLNLVDGVRGVIAVDVRVSIYTVPPGVVQGTSMGTIRADGEKFIIPSWCYGCHRLAVAGHGTLLLQA